MLAQEEEGEATNKSNHHTSQETLRQHVVLTRHAGCEQRLGSAQGLCKVCLNKIPFLWLDALLACVKAEI